MIPRLLLHVLYPLFVHYRRQCLPRAPRNAAPLRLRHKGAYWSLHHNPLSTQFLYRLYLIARWSLRRSSCRLRRARQHIEQPWPRWSRGRLTSRRSFWGCSLRPTRMPSRCIRRTARWRVRSTPSFITISLLPVFSPTHPPIFTSFWTDRVPREYSFRLKFEYQLTNGDMQICTRLDLPPLTTFDVRIARDPSARRAAERLLGTARGSA